MLSVASSLPGRVRLRGPALRDAALCARLQARVAGWRHVSSLEANPRTGSLLVRYDGNRLDPARFAARIVKVVEQASLMLEPAPARAHGVTSRVRANRHAKRGMLASLAASLLLAGAGLKRWHALSGGLFAASLAVHLWVHRRQVLR